VPSVAELLQIGRERLRTAGIEPAGRESTLLLGTVLGAREASLLALDHESVASPSEARFRELIERRTAGEPIAYLLGEKEFFGRGFAVDRRVLIPRPETEHLVEIALGLDLPDRARVLDIGTGSGCIAISVAAERRNWQVVATDVSLAALAVARVNARRHRVESRVHLLAADLVGGIDLSSFDVVLGNPPYVEEEIVPFLSRDVRDFEPRVALTAGPEGLEAIRTLLGAAVGLRPGAWLAFEFGFGQGDAIAELARASGTFDRIELRRDLAGIERDVLLRRGDG
jgi:release factor glutamine methyltransferase